MSTDHDPSVKDRERKLGRILFEAGNFYVTYGYEIRYSPDPGTLFTVRNGIPSLLEAIATCLELDEERPQ